MECEYFGECGACIVYENGYEAQLKDKLDINKERFSPFYTGEYFIAKSPESNYRSRSEFKVWHVEDDIHFAMNHVDKKGIVLVDECPQVNIYISKLMPKLLSSIKNKNIGFKLFGADFLSSSDGEIVVSLLYHRKLDDEWRELANEIADELGIYIIGRSRKQKVIIGQDYITETFSINNNIYKAKHI